MYTPANADVSPLVREIASAVAKSEMDNFFREAFERIDDLFDFSKEIKFSFEVLKLNDPIISGSLLKYLRNDGKSILKEFIEKYPSILNDLGFSPQEIRKFWTSDIKRYRNPLSIYASMLRNGLIPNEQIPEANEKLSYLNQLPESNEDNWILIDNGFGEAMHQQLFINHSTQNHYKHWEFMNANKYVYTKYIERYPLSDEAIKILHFEFDKDDWRAQWLQDSLDEMFTQNENKRQEVKERFLSIGLSLPRYLSSLNR
ncbi:MAG: hypothetical protein EOO18_13690 [Chryseobacterium sp.]|nr:MAG: hypothetical protein EOO18_13690 [Chryseobacterium sp.]